MTWRKEVIFTRANTTLLYESFREIPTTTHDRQQNFEGIGKKDFWVQRIDVAKGVG
jgi:hypothetical protein